jgi:hypothetical protein
MTDLPIAPEFLYDINRLLVDNFYNRRYKIRPCYALNSFKIHLEGYFVENYKLKSEDIDNLDLSDSFYRDERIDFWMIYQGTKDGNFEEGRGQEAEGRRSKRRRGFRPQPIANTVRMCAFIPLGQRADGTECITCYLINLFLPSALCPLPSAFPG